jgi:mRNA-degrading endonuclease RelE of RelBE toxin-antitoxin system
MNYSIIPTHKFEREIKRLIKKFPSLKKEYASLIMALKTNPTTGTSLGNDCYKIRLAVASKIKVKAVGQELSLM